MPMKAKKLKFIWSVLLIATPVVIYAANLSIPNTFSAGTPILSAQMNANFQAVQNAVNTKQDAITQTCPSGEAITSIGTNGTTGTATCTAFPGAINQTCQPGQAIGTITNNVATCTSPVVQSCMIPLPASPATASPTVIFPAAAGNPATSCGQTHITTGTLPQNCLVTVNCTLTSAAILAGGAAMNIEEKVGTGAADCVNSCGTGNSCCNGWYQSFPAAQSGFTSASMTQQIVCPANTTCTLGAILFGTQSTGTTNAAYCQVSYFCIPT